MRMADSRFLKIIIKPISIGINRILRTRPSGSLLIGFYPRKFCRIRICHKSFHFFNEFIREKMLHSHIIVTFINIMSKLQRIHHFRHINRRTKTYGSTICNPCFFLLATFGRYQNNTVCSTGTINSRCRSILQHTNTCNIGRIHILHALFYSIH